MNKYQKALDNIHQYLVFHSDLEDSMSNEITTLQELINIATTPICEDCEPTDLEEAKIKLRLMADETNSLIKTYKDVIDNLRTKIKQLESEKQ